MTNWPTQPYDIVAAGKELGLSPKREATPWFSNKAGPKDDWREKSGALSLPKRNSLELPRRERLQEQLERESRDSRKPKSEAIAEKLIESAAAQMEEGWIYDRIPRATGIYEVSVRGWPESARLTFSKEGWRHGYYMSSSLEPKPEADLLSEEEISRIARYRIIQPKQEVSA